MKIDWRYKLKKKLIEFEDGKATIDQIEELVEGIFNRKGEKTFLSKVEERKRLYQSQRGKIK